MVADINSSGGSTPLRLKYVDGTLFFQADDGNHGAELWKTNGTAESTLLVMDINPGSGSSTPELFVLVEDILYFTADDGVHGREPWALDFGEVQIFLPAVIH